MSRSKVLNQIGHRMLDPAETVASMIGSLRCRADRSRRKRQVEAEQSW